MAAQNISLNAYNSLVINIPITNADGSQADLSGATGAWWLANGSYPGATVYIKKSTMAGTATLAQNSSQQWVLSLTLLPADTASLANPLYYEAEVVDVSGNIYTVASGSLVLKPTIIR